MKSIASLLRAAVCAAAVCAPFLFAACQKKTGVDKPDQVKPKFVVVQPVPKGFIRSSFVKPGELKPVIQVTLSAQSPGQIMQVGVKEGDVVKSGQMLAVIDDRELRAAYAQVNAQLISHKATFEKMRNLSRPQEIAKLESAVESARVGYENAEKNLARASELFDSGVVPLSHVENARVALETAKTAYTAAMENLSLAKEGARKEELLSAEAAVKAAEAELERIAIQIDKAAIKAPVDGVIAKVYIDPSELVAPGTPVCDLVNLSNMQAQVWLSEADLITVKPGDTVAVTLRLAPGQPIPGIITAISPAIDKSTGAFMVEVTTPNPGGQILGGFYADFEFTRAAVKDAIIAPIDALINENDNWFAFVVNGGRAEKRPVKLGILTPEFAQVVEGLEKDSLLVITGQRLLSDGDLVEITRTDEPKLPSENKTIKEMQEAEKEKLEGAAKRKIESPALEPEPREGDGEKAPPEKQSGNGENKIENGASSE